MRPDIYVQDRPVTPSIDGASTTAVGFVGITQKGAIDSPILVTSFSDFVDKCGSFIPESQLAYAVKGYFDNGGSIAYISRVVKHTEGVKQSAPASLAFGTVGSIQAVSDGAWGNSISIECTSDASGYDLRVHYKGDVIPYTGEKISDLVTQLRNSPLITLVVTDSTASLPTIAKAPLAGGADGITGIADADYIGDANKGTGLYNLDKAPINLIAVPSITSTAVLTALQSYVASRKYILALVDTPIGTTPEEATTFASTANLSGELVSVIYPNLRVINPVDNTIRVVPATGHYAGVIAKTDANVGVWKAPAGVNTAILGIVGTEYEVNPTEHGILNDKHVNVILSVDNYGICVMGARTLSKGAGRYLNSLRTKLHVGSTLSRELKWVLFENNDADARSKVYAQCYGFLFDLWQSKGLVGSNAKEAFTIKCDLENNTKSDIDNGRFNIDIGIATQKPAEFVFIRLEY